MRFDLQRAFPYPVLRPHNDDYVDGEFQATVEFIVPTQDLAEVKVEVACAISVDEIRELIENDKARYIVVFSCRETFLRRVEPSHEPEFTTSFAPGDLRGEVEAFPFVVATEQIDNFKCTLINSEWGQGPFLFDTGAVLAIEQPRSVYIDREAFHPISSVFVLVRDRSLREHEWKLSTDDDIVRIRVSPQFKETIERVRNTNKSRAVLVNSIYFAAVMQCVIQLKQQELASDCRWGMVFEQKAAQLGIDLNEGDESSLRRS